MDKGESTGGNYIQFDLTQRQATGRGKAGDKTGKVRRGQMMAVLVARLTNLGFIHWRRGQLWWVGEAWTGLLCQVGSHTPPLHRVYTVSVLRPQTSVLSWHFHHEPLLHTSHIFITLVLVICCCVTNYPNIQQLRTPHIFYLTVSVESRPNLAGSSGSGPLTELQTSCWLGHSHLKARVWYDVLPSSFSGCWQD